MADNELSHVLRARRTANQVAQADLCARKRPGPRGQPEDELHTLHEQGVGRQDVDVHDP